MRRSASHTVLDALRPLCGASRHTTVLRCHRCLFTTQGSVSGPTSSGSFALTLIRRSPQRAIPGPVQLARRPASHPPDQRQSSAVTYVALCVVSAIVIEKRFFNYRATLRVACSSGRSASSWWRSASHSGSARSVTFVYGSRHLFAPRRLTLKDQSKQNPGSVSGPTSSGSFALSLIRGPPQRTIHGPVRLARRPASHPPDQRQSSAVTYVAPCVASDIALKSVFSTIVRRSASHAVLDALRPLCGAPRHTAVL
ncbi:hypothetical protein BV327_05752 [Pseudomonas syringae pv. actinidiae]|uniref:Uncharacterized conserved protein YcbX n=1 Tax=Pseudomonas syringae pv. actinidiae TaxID=103796 RepID=A0AAN4TKS0_PSESF|nr:hypothetical protein BV327_05752 [Pseudomonas syringae pv. actinidiae]GBH17163.1 Uncharacterized conserved protein YcbX [Pseudomonas syringae pv. actinidiae]